MHDTSKEIHELQLRAWLSKSPAERLKQFMEDNASLFKFWDMMQKTNNLISEPTVQVQR